MEDKQNPWKIRFERERKSRKESEKLLEEKSLELWNINQALESEVHERTESLKNALIKAEQADRAKSDFLANMSHEIRTPLNAIIGFSQYLSKSDDLSEKNAKYSSIIETSANSLLSIINDILDFSKIESGNFEVFKNDCNIYEICNHVVELFSQKTSEKDIKFTYTFDENIPNNIITDGIRVRQVLSNLISNAIKFTPEYGEINFSVLLIKKENDTSNIEFKIEDSGIGIPKDKISSVLSPFVQLEQVANKHQIGTGLGLSICNNILKLLDSNLNVTSELGRGSVFSFILESDISKVSIEDEVKEDEVFNVNGKILVAEDNSANQELIKLILDDLNIDFQIASNGKEVIDIYKDNPSFDLILMDINMPVLNGIEAFYLIREFEEVNYLDEIPVVALTANAIKGDREKFMSLGMNDYLSKPINVNELKRVTSKYLNSSNTNEDKNQTETSSILDIKKISEKIGIGENIASLIVEKFKKEIVNDLKELKDFIENEDYENISKKAHYIKNSCLNVVLDDACEILQDLETSTSDLESIKNKFEKLSNILKSIS